MREVDVDVFKLDEDEWKEAVRSKPELLANDEMMKYFPRSANAWIEPKKDNYFDNEVILRQFERLFIMLSYKRQFRGCKFEILVDNATTHSTKVYDINKFNKFPGTQCIYRTIEWDEDGVTNM